MVSDRIHLFISTLICAHSLTYISYIGTPQAEGRDDVAGGIYMQVYTYTRACMSFFSSFQLNAETMQATLRVAAQPETKALMGHTWLRSGDLGAGTYVRGEVDML